MKIKVSLKNLILIGILVIGCGLRFYKLGMIPLSLYWDEVAIGYDGWSIATTGKDMHGKSMWQAMFSSYGDYKLPAYIWFTGIAIKLIGPSAFAVRVTSAVAGVILILLIYGITNELVKDADVSLVAALTMALMPTEIIFSRTGFEGHLALCFLGVTVWGWLKSRKHLIWLILTSITGAAAVYSYFSARMVVPIVAISMLGYLYKLTDLKWKLGFVGSLVLWVGLLVPIYQSPYYHNSNQFRLSTVNLLDVSKFAIESNVAREQSGNTLITRLIYHRYLLQTKAIVVNLFKHLDLSYLFITGDNNLRHGTGRAGLLLGAWLPLFIFGWISLVKTRRWRLTIFLGTIWIASLIPASIPVEVPHALRSMDANLIFPIVTALGLVELTKVIKLQGLWLVYIGFSLVEMGLFTHDYFVHYPIRSAQAWQYGYEQLVTNLSRLSDQFDQVVLNVGDDRLFLYFLFFNKVNPTEINYPDGPFNFEGYQKFRFAPDKLELKNSRQWIVENSWNEFGHPNAQLVMTIDNPHNETLFWIWKGQDNAKKL